MVIFYVALGLVFLITTLYTIKYLVIKQDLKKINKRLIMVRENETNVMVDTITKDKDIIKLARLINTNLSHINELRIQYNHEEIEIRNTISNLSHDLRTPITSILGYLQLFESDPYNEKGKEYLNIINNRMQTVKQLIEELFSYSLVYESDQLMEIKDENINLILEDAIAIFYNELVEKEINPIIEIPDKQIIKKVDKLALKRVFTNLLSNAIKYGKNYLRIILTDDDVIFQNKTDSFDQIDVGKLFDRFFTVKRARNNNSMGLGLTISKTLIEKMEGNISASLDNDLLTFRIRLK